MYQARKISSAHCLILYDKKDEELMANLGFDNDMLRSLDNGKKTLLIGAKELKSQVKRRTLTLCQTCVKNSLM